MAVVAVVIPINNIDGTTDLFLNHAGTRQNACRNAADGAHELIVLLPAGTNVEKGWRRDEEGRAFVHVSVAILGGYSKVHQ